MKARESGMPEEEMWRQFFDVDLIFNELEINNTISSLVDFGFGYGTFTIPASRKINGIVHAYDIEDSLVRHLKQKLSDADINNVLPINEDFFSSGTSFRNGEIDYVMLFNILHAEKSDYILNESYRILKDSGKIGVIHWNYDPGTPRGPSMAIRPKPEEISEMLKKAGFSILKDNINLPPYHYGILGKK